MESVMQNNPRSPARRSLAGRRLLGLSAVSLMMVTLAGCTTPFKADVKRFQAQLPAPTGQTFAVVADDPRDAGGLEFAQYASVVGKQMEKLGYRPANADVADLIVKFDYGIDGGRDRVRNTGFNDPFWGGWGAWGGWGPGWGRGGWGRRGFGGWGWGWNDPFFFGGGGWGGGVDVVTVYTSGIDLKIDRRADGQRLFEGKAEAASQSNRLSYVVPNLVEAMFTDFPGNNGETVRISIAPEKKTVKKID
ncbi:MAG: lipoprotein transmembrane [Novosphingobium sp. 28-62-57]|nr:MAG: lipoprotein transmembrane [Novosphingobium sp. 12-62-10]OYZ09328.1 MAG: lipoprotein transmembrane [Novosphingobium sp. 28-62-57]OZA39149.1 MAG: lipoprotein transmembrane [Novosphingobium sp. 17-62-9]